MKTFQQYNESVRDKMTPKSEKDIREDLSKAPIPNQFIRSCQGGYLDIVKQTLQPVKDSQNYLSLVYMGMRKSIEGGFLDIFKYLVDNTELNYLHHNREELLRSAAENGYTDIVKYLITLGADIHVQNEEPLFKAIYFGHVDCVKLLLDSGAKLQDCYIRKDISPEMKKFLLQYDKTNEGVRDKMTPKSKEEIWNSVHDSLDDGYKLSRTISGLLNMGDSVYQKFWQNKDVIHELLLTIPNYEIDLKTITDVLKEADARLAFGIEHIYVPIWHSLPIEQRKETLKIFIEKYKIL